MSYVAREMDGNCDEDDCASSNAGDRLLGTDKGQTWSKSRYPGRGRVGVLCTIAHVCGWLFALLVVHFYNASRYHSGDDANRLVPRMNTELVRFSFETDDWVPGPNDPNVTDVIFDNWTRMLPRGKGVVKVPNWESFPHLTQPTELLNHEVGFNTAWVHELHCVYWVMKEYHRVLHHGPDGTEYFIDQTHNSYHTSHCFNYIRQAILCALDTALEGAGDGVGVADGSAQVHVCRSHQQSIDWLEDRRLLDYRAIA